jgi:hypothetical protein
MAQIVPGAPNIGQQLGSGLSAGLSALAEQKFSQLARREAHREKTSRLIGLGLPANEANYIAGLEDKYAYPAVNQFYNSGGGQQGQSYGEQTPQGQPQTTQEQQQPQQNLEQLAGQANQIPGANTSPEQLMLQSLASGQPLTPIQALMKSIESRQASQNQQQSLGSPPQSQPGQPQSSPQEDMMMGHPMPQDLKDMIAQSKSEAEPKKRASAFGQGAATGEEGGVTAKELRKEHRADKIRFEKEEKEEQKRIDTELKPYITKLRTEKDAADFSQPRLNKMKDLVKKGGLPVSSLYTVLKNIEDHVGLGAGAGAGTATGATIGGLLAGPGGAAAGAGVGALIGGGIGAVIGPVSSLIRHVQKTTSPNTESFEKLSASFLRGAKDIFGGRFTNEEMKAYLASIPTLAQTDKGKLDVINDMELFNKAAKIKYSAAQQIIKENGGRPPANLPELVEERVQTKLDKLSDIFKKDL